MGLFAVLPLFADAPKSDVSLRKGTWQDVQNLVKKNRGKVLVVDAWSTSCIPCMREFPNLVALQKKFGSDVVCISFSCDYVGIKGKPPEFYEERVLNFLKKQKAGIINILGTQPSDEAYEQMGIESIPAVFVYDQEGRLAQKFDAEYKHAGGEDEPFTYQDVRALLQKLVGRTANGAGN